MSSPRHSAWQPLRAELSTMPCAFPSWADGPGLPGVTCRGRREHPRDRPAGVLCRAVRWWQLRCAPLKISGGEPAPAIAVGARTRRLYSEGAAQLHA